MGNCSSAPRLKVNLKAFIAASPTSEGYGDEWYFDTMNVLLDRWAYSHVQFLRKKFLEATGDRGEKELDKKGFFKLFAELQDMPKAVAESAFRMFDTDNSGKLNFREFCCALALCCHLMSSDDEKIRFVFDMFDTNDDGLLTSSDVQLLLESALPRDEGKEDERKADDTSAESKELSLGTQRQQRIAEIKQELLASSQHLTFERFCEWAYRNLDSLSNLLHTFQIVPSPERERAICEEILSRHLTLQEGSTWYCISHKWLQVWKAHANWQGPAPGRHTVRTSSGSGLLTVTHDVSQLAVQDEDAISEEPPTHACAEIGAVGNVHHMSTRPPEIDNSDLEGEHKGELKMNLVEHLDYELIPEEMWQNLVEWYGGGPAIMRKVICMGQDHQPQVELYPPLLLVVVAGESGQPLPQFSRRFFISRQSSLDEVLHMLADKLARAADRSRLWHRAKGEQWRPVQQMGITLEEFLEGKVWDAGAFMLETQQQNCEWPRDSIVAGDGITNADTALAERELQMHFEVGDRVEAQSGVKNQWMRGTIVDTTQQDHSSAHSQVKVHYDSTVYKSDEWISTASERLAPLDTHTSPNSGGAESCAPLIRGATGLQNLGNTCFLNATIQCMANTPLLREYFLSMQYMRDVNDKGMGCKGRLAEEFGQIIGELWSGKDAMLTPRGLKRTIDQFAPQFAGYEQHDAQELLAFLLDGLHEDLNRSPATGVGASGGRLGIGGTRREAGLPKLFSSARTVRPGGFTRSGSADVSPKRAKAAWRERSADHTPAQPRGEQSTPPPSDVTVVSATDAAVSSGGGIPMEHESLHVSETAVDSVPFEVAIGGMPIPWKENTDASSVCAQHESPALDSEAHRNADRSSQQPMLWSRTRRATSPYAGEDEANLSWPAASSTALGTQPCVGGTNRKLGHSQVGEIRGMLQSTCPGSASSTAGDDDQAPVLAATGLASARVETSSRRIAQDSDNKRHGTSRWWSFAWRRGRGALDLPKELHGEQVHEAEKSVKEAVEVSSKDATSTSIESNNMEQVVAVPPLVSQGAPSSYGGLGFAAGQGPVTRGLDTASSWKVVSTDETQAAACEASDAPKETMALLEDLRPKPPAGSAGAAVAAAAANRVSEVREDGLGESGTYNESEDFVPELLTPHRPGFKRSLSLFNLTWRRRRIEDDGGAPDGTSGTPPRSPKRRPRTPPTMTPLREEVGTSGAAVACGSGAAATSVGSCSSAESDNGAAEAKPEMREGHSGVEAAGGDADGATGQGVQPQECPIGSDVAIGTPSAIAAPPSGSATRSFLPWKGKRPNSDRREARRDCSREPDDEAVDSVRGGSTGSCAAAPPAAQQHQAERAISREGRVGRTKEKESAWPSFLRRSKSRDGSMARRARNQGALRPPPVPLRGDLPIVDGVASGDPDPAPLIGANASAAVATAEAELGLADDASGRAAGDDWGGNRSARDNTDRCPKPTDFGIRLARENTDPCPKPTDSGVTDAEERPQRGGGLGFPFLRAPWKRGEAPRAASATAKPSASSASHSPQRGSSYAGAPSEAHQGAAVGSCGHSSSSSARCGGVAFSGAAPRAADARRTDGERAEAEDGRAMVDDPGEPWECSDDWEVPRGGLQPARELFPREQEPEAFEENGDDEAEADEDDLPDEEKAARQWDLYRARNRSLVVDIFEGQLRSQLTCCHCGASSSTFEPFRYLSVPIPSNHVDRATLRIVFFPLPYSRGNGRPQLARYSVTVAKSATVQKVERALSRLLPVAMTSVLLAEVYRSRIHRYLDSCLPLSDVRAEDQLFAFEVLQSPTELMQYQELHAPPRQRRERPEEKGEDEKKVAPPRVLLIQAMHRRVVDVCRSDGRTWAQRREVFGLPFVMSAASSWTYATLHEMLMLHARRFLRSSRTGSRRDGGGGSGYAGGAPSSEERAAQMPFVARIVNASGTACGACDRRNCTGCLLPKGGARLRLRAGLLTGAVNTAKIYLALDWVDSVAYDQEYVDTVVEDQTVTGEAECQDRDDVDEAQYNSEGAHRQQADGSRSSGPGLVPITACIDAFAEPEHLKQELGNGVKCEKCGEVVDAVKRLEIWREPDVLLLHIKRFHFSGVHFEKLNTPVEVLCRELNLRPWIVGPSASSSAPYELYAVACHNGGMSGGHYTSYCANTEGKETVWLKFNDEFVTGVSLPQELDDISRQCYVLFYRKRAFSSSNLINYSSLL